MTRQHFKRLFDPTEEKAQVPTKRQLLRLLEVAAQGANGNRNLAMIWMSYGAALRATELAHLKVIDVLERSGEIKKEGRLPGSYTKNGKGRWFWLLEPAARDALRSYLAWRLKNGLRVTGVKDYRGLQPDSPLFLSGTGGFSFRTRTYQRTDGTIAEYKVSSVVQQILSKLHKDAGIPKGSSHSGRRALATRLSDRLIDERFIQVILDHSTTEQTMDYIEASQARIRRALSQGIYQDT